MKAVFVLWNALRVLLSAAAALALLLCFSYPDSVIPPDPAKEYLEGWNLYTLRGYVWVLPLAAGVLVSALGPRFFRVWFAGMLSVGIAALWAWPVLRADYPELVSSELPWQSGGMLTLGLVRFAIVLFAGFLVLLLLRFLFPEPEATDVGVEDAAVLDPEKARTVQQIAADPLRPEPKFLFGAADISLVQRFGELWRGLLLRSWRNRLLLLAAVLLSAAWVVFYPQPSKEEALQRDMARMQEHVRLRGMPIGTRGAVHAALRVMQHISDEESFAGMTREEAEHWLGLDKVDPAYRALLRDTSDVSIPSVNNAFESRERFLTVRDVFGHWAVLYIRTDAEDKHINVAEVQDAGWNAVVDERRRRLGNDYGSSMYR